jgi:release factor glutamine methyltransferase
LKIKKIFRESIRHLIASYENHEASSITRLLFEELELDYLKVFSNPDMEIHPDKYRKLKLFLEKLERNTPVQYVLGYSWFYDRKFRVDPGCLIPRQETEELVSIILKEKKAFPFILDIGTGSGCIAITIKAEIPESEVWAMDKYSEALKNARANAELQNLDINFLEDDILIPNHKLYPEEFDLIVSNPPYVRESEKDQMHANVIDNEPGEALFVEDSDPLIFYRAIRDFCTFKLKRGGILYLEINEKLGDETASLFVGEFEDTRIVKDLSGKNRFIKTRRK